MTVKTGIQNVMILRHGVAPRGFFDGNQTVYKDQTAVPTLGIDNVELKVAEFLWRA